MLKVCTSYSKKVPTDQQYSSQQFHASVEVELSDALSPEDLQDRIRQTFDLVKSSVETEINGNGTSAKEAPASRNNGGRSTSPTGSANGNGHGKASNAQIKYITSLATEQDIRLSALNDYCREHFRVDSLYELTKKDASALVDALKRGKVKIPA